MIKKNPDQSDNVVNFALPALHDVMAFRGLYVLATTRYNKLKGRATLTTTHYASCLVFGPDPLWGVWTVHGRFLRFYTKRSDITDAYPKLVWRRKMASWQLLAVEDLKADARRAMLQDKYPTKDSEST